MSQQTNLIIGEIRAELGHAQVARGYDSAHDDRHEQGELASAAIAYIMGDASMWPFDAQRFHVRHGHHRDELIKAAGLIISEIARLDRAGRTK